MASREGPSCMGIGVEMPMDHGHDYCVLCLGDEHALTARDNPALYELVLHVSKTKSGPLPCVWK